MANKIQFEYNRKSKNEKLLILGTLKTNLSINKRNELLRKYNMIK